MTYAKSPETEPADRFELHNGNISIGVLRYGARIDRIATRDRNGAIGNVVLHRDSVEAYQTQKWRYGATIGRYANRIAGGSFELNGKTYNLSTNEGNVTLHGGERGFDTIFWDVVRSSDREVVLRYVSPDGDQGFPGELTVDVALSLPDENTLRIDYSATTTAATVVNLTNHSYFNLSADPSISIGEHVVQILASHYTPVDARKIPTGEIAPVNGTRFDLREPDTVGAVDLNFVLDRPQNGELAPAAVVYDARSGRSLHIETTEPGIQLFTGKGNGIALETQHFPDSPHHANFPSTALRLGERFNSSTIYRFTVAYP